jgi:hypothetical protein
MNPQRELHLRSRGQPALENRPQEQHDSICLRRRSIGSPHHEKACELSPQKDADNSCCYYQQCLDPCGGFHMDPKIVAQKTSPIFVLTFFVRIQPRASLQLPFSRDGHKMQAGRALSRRRQSTSGHRKSAEGTVTLALMECKDLWNPSL